MKLATLLLLATQALAASNDLDAYLVLLRPEVPFAQFREMSERCAAMTPPDAPEELRNPYTVRVRVGEVKVLRCGCAKEDLDRLVAENLDAVKEVEKDDVVELSSVPVESVGCPDVSEEGSWGTRRTTARHAFIGPVLQHNASWGDGVDIYILDTGVNCQHIEFKGRCQHGVNFVTTEGPEDVHGHGTHVAGTAAGATVGLAQAANIISVKVIGDGSSSTSWILAGVEYAVAAATRSKRRSVINMSLSTRLNHALNALVKAAADQGIVPVVAAGNNNIDSCYYRSPASEPSAITVAATGMSKYRGDFKAIFSSHGVCVDIHAPGANINSSVGNGTDYDVYSGTSMASPLVAGAAALALSLYPDLTVQEVRDLLVNVWSIPHSVTEAPFSDPRNSLFIPCSDPLPAPIEDSGPVFENCYGVSSGTLFKKGSIRHPEKDDNLYGAHDFKCWNLVCPEGSSSMIVTFSEYDISRNPAQPDLLTVDEQPVLSVNDIIRVSKPETIVLFDASGPVSGYGFELYFKCEASSALQLPTSCAAPSVTEWGGVVNMTGYAPNTSLCWELECPADKPQGLFFMSEMDVEETFDTIVFQNHTFSGNVTPSPFFFDLQGQLTFTSDMNDEDIGFVAAYFCTNLVPISNTTEPEQGKCLELNGSGTFSYKYGNAEERCWHLRCPAAQYATLMFTELDLEGSFDFLYVNGQPLTGSALPAIFNATGEEGLALELTSDSTNNGSWSAALFCNDAPVRPSPVSQEPFAVSMDDCIKLKAGVGMPFVMEQYSFPAGYLRCWDVLPCSDGSPVLMRFPTWNMSSFSSIYINAKLVEGHPVTTLVQPEANGIEILISTGLFVVPKTGFTVELTCEDPGVVPEQDGCVIPGDKTTIEDRGCWDFTCDGELSIKGFTEEMGNLWVDDARLYASQDLIVTNTTRVTFDPSENASASFDISCVISSPEERCTSVKGLAGEVVGVDYWFPSMVELEDTCFTLTCPSGTTGFLWFSEWSHPYDARLYLDDEYLLQKIKLIMYDWSFEPALSTFNGTSTLRFQRMDGKGRGFYGNVLCLPDDACKQKSLQSWESFRLLKSNHTEHLLCQEVSCEDKDMIVQWNFTDHVPLAEGKGTFMDTKVVGGPMAATSGQVSVRPSSRLLSVGSGLNAKATCVPRACTELLSHGETLEVSNKDVTLSRDNCMTLTCPEGRRGIVDFFNVRLDNPVTYWLPSEVIEYSTLLLQGEEYTVNSTLPSTFDFSGSTRMYLRTPDEDPIGLFRFLFRCYDPEPSCQVLPPSARLQAAFDRDVRATCWSSGCPAGGLAWVPFANLAKDEMLVVAGTNVSTTHPAPLVFSGPGEVLRMSREVLHRAFDARVECFSRKCTQMLGIAGNATSFTTSEGCMQLLCPRFSTGRVSVRGGVEGTFVVVDGHVVTGEFEKVVQTAVDVHLVADGGAPSQVTVFLECAAEGSAVQRSIVLFVAVDRAPEGLYQRIQENRAAVQDKLATALATSDVVLNDVCVGSHCSAPLTFIYPRTATLVSLSLTAYVSESVEQIEVRDPVALSSILGAPVTVLAVTSREEESPAVDSEDSGLSKGAIGAIIVGSVAFAGIVAAAVAYIATKPNDMNPDENQI